MAKFKLIVSDPGTGKATVAELEGSRAQALVGRDIGDVLDGSVLGVGSSKIRITGGCDKDGIPMRADVHGGGRKYIVLAGGIGFRPRRPGERRRKLVRGRIVTDQTYQINAVVVREAKLAEGKPAVAVEKEPEELVKEIPAKRVKPEKRPPKKVKKKPR